MKIRLFWLGLMLLFFSRFSLAEVVFRPEQFRPLTGSLLVVIHGCLQSAEVMAMGTGWNRKASRSNMAVFYPQVRSGTHPLGCWSWYLSENQRPQSGQLRSLFDSIQKVKEQLGLPTRARVYLTGISSGGAIVSGLLACFPQSFTSAMIHSGVSYGLARNAQEAEKVLKEGPDAVQRPSNLPCDPKKYSGSIMVIQGDEDQVVHPSNASRIIQDFIGQEQVLREAEYNQNGLTYQVTDYVPRGRSRGRVVMVQGLGHAWSGYSLNQDFPSLIGSDKAIKMVLPFFSELGPSATDLSFQFFTGRAR